MKDVSINSISRIKYLVVVEILTIFKTTLDFISELSCRLKV